jgi:flagellar hook-associated protein 2
MGSFSTGIGLISGLDTASLINQILLGESRGRVRLQNEIATLQARQSSMLEVNARLLGLQSSVDTLLSASGFGAMQATSSDTGILSVLASGNASPGAWSFLVSSLATRHQVLGAGHASTETELGLESMTIELGGGDLVRDTELAILNGGAGVDRGSIEITIGSGSNETVHVIDLSDVVTINDVIDRLAEAGSDFTAHLDGAGLRLETSDGREIAVQSLSGASTAEDLGLVGDGSSGVLVGTGIAVLGGETPLSSLNDGNGVLLREGSPDLRITTRDGRSFDVDIPSSASTLQDVLDAINNALDSSGAANAGAIVAEVWDDGLRLDITDTTSGSGTFSVQSTAGNPSAASDLGIEMADAGSSSINGQRLIAELGTVLLGSLAGGQGIDPTATMSVVDRAGATTNITIPPRTGSLDELLDSMNQQVDDAGVGIRFEHNAAGNGLRIVDTTGIETPGANLQASGSLATVLGLEVDAAVSSFDGENMQHQYVSRSTLLSSLNGGQGVAIGSFTIRDASGDVATIDVEEHHETVDDLLRLIESKGLDITARVNDHGDGIIIESTASEEASTVTLLVQAGTGSTAADLNLLGESASVHGSDARIDGSWEYTIEVDATTTLSQLVDRISAAGIPVQATLVNTGGGADPWHLSLASDRQGAGGRFTLDARHADGSTMETSVTVEGDDARVFLGENAADGLLVQSSSNTL